MQICPSPHLKCRVQCFLLYLRVVQPWFWSILEQFHHSEKKPKSISSPSPVPSPISSVLGNYQCISSLYGFAYSGLYICIHTQNHTICDPNFFCTVYFKVHLCFYTLFMLNHFLLCGHTIFCWHIQWRTVVFFVTFWLLGMMDEHSCI